MIKQGWHSCYILGDHFLVSFWNVQWSCHLGSCCMHAEKPGERRKLSGWFTQIFIWIYMYVSKHEQTWIQFMPLNLFNDLFSFINWNNNWYTHHNNATKIKGGDVWKVHRLRPGTAIQWMIGDVVVIVIIIIDVVVGGGSSNSGVLVIPVIVINLSWFIKK